MILAEISAKSAHYWAAGFEDREDSEYYRIIELEHLLKLYLNPKEADHGVLLDKIGQMTNRINSSNFEKDKEFWDAHNSVISISQKVLKREWERVKNDI